MTDYRFVGLEKSENFELLVATHPASPGTQLVYVWSDAITMTPVILWGVLIDGTPVPITQSGVWDGSDQMNQTVLHSDGRCTGYEESWETLDAAVEHIRKSGRVKED
ncbi:MAG TPA: hypothetical protein VD768_08670 [Sphingomicrobium sp.]|nr:hypothetical protein [Sphingomicrobium sp.]